MITTANDVTSYTVEASLRVFEGHDISRVLSDVADFLSDEDTVLITMSVDAVEDASWYVVRVTYDLLD